MNPKTGEFFEEDAYPEEFRDAIERGDLPAEIPDEWPRFAVGDEFTLKGYPFTLYRINATSLVLRPVLPKGEISARRVMRRMVGK